MASQEMSFEDLILGQISDRGYDRADFASLPKDMRAFLHLLYPNPRDQIAYIVSECYDRVASSSVIGWMGVVRTQDRDREGGNALFISCEPFRSLQEQDVVPLDNINSSFKTLAVVLKPFFRVQSVISLQQDSRQSVIMIAQGYFGSKLTLLV